MYLPQTATLTVCVVVFIVLCSHLLFGTGCGYSGACVNHNIRITRTLRWNAFHARAKRVIYNRVFFFFVISSAFANEFIK